MRFSNAANFYNILEGHVGRHLLNMTQMVDAERLLNAELNFSLSEDVVELLLMQTELFFSILVSCTIKLKTGPHTVFIFCNKLLLII